MKWVKRIVFSLLALLLLTFLAGYFWLRSSVPEYEGEIQLNGLTSEVQTWFDEYGIPHIKAENRADLYKAFGYVHASERLFQMEMLRRAGGGRLAEIIGPDVLPIDILFRSIGLSEYADQSDSLLHLNPSPMMADIESYLSGINEFIAEGSTPAEFKLIGIEKTPFTTRDLFLITGAMSYSFSQAQKTEPVVDFICQNYGQEYLNDIALWHSPKETFIPSSASDRTSNALTTFGSQVAQVDQILPIAPLQGSNSWAVSGKRTKSGKVLFCNDTHIGYLLPQTWYEAYLECPGFNLYGHFLGAVPFALVGRKHELSWGLTMLLNDDMDFYRETFHPSDSSQVMFQNEWVNVSMQSYSIKIKGQSDKVLQVRQTPHGPIINDAFPDMGKDEPISMQWTYTALPNKTMEAFYGMNNATSMAEFESFLPFIHAPGLNMNYGDAEGNIAWWSCASLVKRPEHVNPWSLLDGASGLDEQEGYYSFDQNPHIVNPDRGFIYSANDWPAQMDSLYYPGYYKPQYRGDRIRTLLSSRSDWDSEGMKEVMTDRTNSMDSIVMNHFLRRVMKSEAISEDPEMSSMIEAMRGWSGSYAPDENVPVLFTRMLYHFLKETCEDELGPERFELFLATHQVQRAYSRLAEERNSPWFDDVRTEAKETQDSILFRAFRASVSELQEQFGPNWKVWKWSKVCSLELKHPLGNVSALKPIFNLGPYMVSGSNETIQQSGFKMQADGACNVFFGSQMRIITDYGDPSQCWNVTPAGQSGHRLSPHYNDQTDLYVRGEFRPQHASAQSLEKVGTVLRFVP